MARAPALNWAAMVIWVICHSPIFLLIVWPSTVWAGDISPIEAIAEVVGIGLFSYAVMQHANRPKDPAREIPLEIRRKRGPVALSIGLVCEALARPFQNSGVNLAISAAPAMLIGGMALYIWGSVQLLKGKGYSAWLVLPAVLSPIHFTVGLILAFGYLLLPDRTTRTLSKPAEFGE